ncbi:hypothetical protein R1sor_024905 [Riccia sorocarpa]|uniref:Glycerol-3-phosphate acyltransferase, chloroplastic n=1 Tax=Riccia sorocarpa TaxID=122646 RepID=A0ABD3GXV0_9MARC
MAGERHDTDVRNSADHALQNGKGNGVKVSTSVKSPRTFDGIMTEEELLNGVRHEVQVKKLPAKANAGLLDFYYNYRDSVIKSGVDNAVEIAVKIMATVFDRIMFQFEEPYTFPPYHTRILEPYNYYAFGQNFIKHLVDLRNSFVGNIATFGQIESQLKQGHNVILFSNHQSEADPAVMALLLDFCHPYLSEKMTFIAGDRVVFDPFCKPFSMGRNFLCVHSKKHINDVPALAEMKKKANAQTLKEMAGLLAKGGQFIWIAPSGGRDRPDPETNEVRPAQFDAAAVENTRRLLSQMPVPGHMYPLALSCYEIMPPPHQVEKELGERRLLGYDGAGIVVASELRFDDLTAGTTSKEQARDKFSQSSWEIVNEQYSVLRKAIHGRQGLQASSQSTQLSQPWFDRQQK